MLLTLTLNPALDDLIFVEHLVLHAKNVLAERRLYAAGKGFNVAKALATLGRPVTAYGFVGRGDVPFYEQALSARGIRLAATPIAYTRTNHKLIERDTGLETEINELGAGITPQEWDRLRNALDAGLVAARWLILSGSVPPGLDKTVFRNLIERAQGAGVKTLLDTSGESLLAGLSARPTILRINRAELGEIARADLKSVGELADVAAGLVTEVIERVVVSLGQQGALLVTRNGRWLAEPPALEVVNAIGAGDVMSAGVVDGIEKGLEPEPLVRWATALATASVTTLESGDVSPILAKEIAPLVLVSKV